MGSDKISLLRQFLEADPSDGFTRYALAMELSKIGDFAGSEAAYRELIRLDANYVGAYYHLGRLLEDQSRKSEAREIYEEGLRRARNLRDNHAASELQQVLDELD